MVEPGRPSDELHTLTIHVDTRRPNYPQVRLLVDGEDVLSTTGCDQGNDPADILDTGALLPLDPPRRIAFYGCGCGTFGCVNVAGLITRRGDRVEWSDFRSLTGVYSAALAPAACGNDPIATRRDDATPPRAHPLPTVAFEAAHYETVTRAAMADRSWETPARAVSRQLRLIRPHTMQAASWRGKGLSVETWVGGDPRTGWSTDLSVPPGPPEEAARRLADLLDDGIDPRRIATEGLWC